MVNCMEKENIYGLIMILMKVAGLIIKCMDKENSYTMDVKRVNGLEV